MRLLTGIHGQPKTKSLDPISIPHSKKYDPLDYTVLLFRKENPEQCDLGFFLGLNLLNITPPK